MLQHSGWHPEHIPHADSVMFLKPDCADFAILYKTNQSLLQYQPTWTTVKTSSLTGSLWSFGQVCYPFEDQTYLNTELRSPCLKFSICGQWWMLKHSDWHSHRRICTRSVIILISRLQHNLSYGRQDYNMQKENKHRKLFTQFGPTWPTSGGYQARKKIHYQQY
jgi:hypothetical protein